MAATVVSRAWLASDRALGARTCQWQYPERDTNKTGTTG
jgi:hypothetical protein